MAGSGNGSRSVEPRDDHNLTQSRGLCSRSRSRCNSYFVSDSATTLSPNPPKDTDGRREDSGRGWVRAKGVYDFDYDEFDLLPSKEIEPIGRTEFLTLSHTIRLVHGTAYAWDALNGLPDFELEELADELFSVYSPDLVRRSVQRLVEVLDGRMENIL